MVEGIMQTLFYILIIGVIIFLLSLLLKEKKLSCLL